MHVVATNPIFYTVEEVSQILKVHYNTVYNWIESGKLKAIKIGGLWRIPADSLPKIGDANGLD